MIKSHCIKFGDPAVNKVWDGSFWLGELASAEPWLWRHQTGLWWGRCAYAMVCVEIRGPLCEAASFLPALCVFQGSILGHQACIESTFTRWALSLVLNTTLVYSSFNNSSPVWWVSSTINANKNRNLAYPMSLLKEWTTKVNNETKSEPLQQIRTKGSV